MKNEQTKQLIAFDMQDEGEKEALSGNSAEGFIPAFKWRKDDANNFNPSGFQMCSQNDEWQNRE